MLDESVDILRSAGELDAAAAHVRMIGCDEGDLRGLLDLGARFRVGVTVDADLSGKDQRACPLTGWREAPFDDELIQTNTQILQP